MNSPEHQNSAAGHLWQDLRRLVPDTYQNFRRKPAVAVGLGLVMTAGISLHWLAVGTEKLVEALLEGHRPSQVEVWFTLGSLALAGCFTALAWGYRHAFKELHVRYRIASSDKPCPYLVLFVSTQPLLTSLTQIPEAGPCVVTDGKNTATLARTNLLTDADELDHKLRWNWEMLLRGLAPHLKTLRRVYLVGSADAATATGVSPGSNRDLETARRLLAPYLLAAGKAATVSGAANLIRPWPEAANFEDFEAVHTVLEKIRRQLVEEQAGDQELCVDITGGQKPTSAAAGTFTMNKEVVLQYVQTNQPKASHIHDVQLLSLPEASH